MEQTTDKPIDELAEDLVAALVVHCVTMVEEKKRGDPKDLMVFMLQKLEHMTELLVQIGAYDAARDRVKNIYDGLKGGTEDKETLH